MATAAKAMGVGRQRAYAIRESDEEFAKAWDEAVEAGTDALEDEAMRRAQKGVKKPVFHKGQVVGHVQEYSDTLAIFMLKGRRPDKFRERSTVEHSGEISIGLADRLEAAFRRVGTKAP